MFINKSVNIVLPVKPIYAIEILDEAKKYEFRKKLCQKEIEKIYIYATAPVKMIVGEAEVVNKLIMDKNEMWRRTQIYAGISKEFYDWYFEKQTYACAYEIGRVKRYSLPVTLDSMGIKHVPQSFIYVY